MSHENPYDYHDSFDCIVQFQINTRIIVNEKLIFQISRLQWSKGALMVKAYSEA